MLNDVKSDIVAKNVIITKVAGETIPANKVIYVNDKAYLASSNQVAHRDRIVGVSVAAAVISANITIRTFGEMYNNTWSWDVAKPIFCGLNGELTQTAPASGFSCIIGNAIDTDRIFVIIQDSILL